MTPLGKRLIDWTEDTVEITPPPPPPTPPALPTVEGA